MSPLASLGFSGGLTTSGIVASSTGATITTYGKYTIHTFSSTSGGTFVVTANSNNEFFDILAIGGGAGGNPGFYNTVSGIGGGGSGGGPGAIIEASRVIPAGTYAVTIGSGGSGGSSPTGGGNTTLGSLITANGGTVTGAGNPTNAGWSGLPGGIGSPSPMGPNSYNGNGTAVAFPPTSTYTSYITGSAVTYGQIGATNGSGANANTYGGSGAGNTQPFGVSGIVYSNGGSGYQGLLIVRYRT